MILEKSLVLGVRNFVAPANRPERLSFYKRLAEKKGLEISVFSPGIGPQGGGPYDAVKAGADFVIVGRSIFSAKKPEEEIVRIYEAIVKAYESRNLLGTYRGSSI